MTVHYYVQTLPCCCSAARARTTHSHPHMTHMTHTMPALPRGAPNNSTASSAAPRLPPEEFRSNTPAASDRNRPDDGLRNDQ